VNLMLAQSQAQPWLDLLAAGGITVVGVLLVVVVAFTKCLEVWNSRRFTLGVFRRHHTSAEAATQRQERS
jgi:hypothetical protein